MVTPIVESTITIGRLRLGFSVSSASGATASNPDRARIVNTTPRYRPFALGRLFGLNESKLKPPWPGEMRPEIASTRKIPTSRLQSTSIAFADSEIPNSVNAVTINRKAKNQKYQMMWIPYCCWSVWSTRSPVNASTDDTAIGSYRKYSHVVIQPVRGPIVRLTYRK